MFQENPPNKALFPLSFGIEKAIVSSLRLLEEITDHNFAHAVADAYSLVYPTAQVLKQLPLLVEAVVTYVGDMTKDKDKPTDRPAVNRGKSLGTRYATWLSDLNTEDVCLYLAEYDPAKAYQIYWFADRNATYQAIKLKSEHDSQVALMQMEACLYGAGGKYSDDGSSDNIHHIDSAEGAAALRSLGF